MWLYALSRKHYAEGPSINTHTLRAISMNAHVDISLVEINFRSINQPDNIQEVSDDMASSLSLKDWFKAHRDDHLIPEVIAHLKNCTKPASPTFGTVILIFCYFPGSAI